ncbi:pilus assembly protein PilM [Schinkia azotoformans]|uniref:type IV pilus biogenesis protein PilM n=1 Tax=Schinkia azotoformans TaxID=1454 RepID=UPI002DB55F6F|nr:pilus assembly protein PilM [Schinkia azotoformans]MEC1720340.1 pilus assembly protein PilM [Schinkia azotoformans]MED4353778.1 pilus assembly protein PilM [Schinkia azotoformans]MED4413343.1 pilus assembly protein PilM [Schinkia azotoformans]
MVLRLFGKKRCANIVIKDHVIRFVEVRSSSPLSVRLQGERELPPGIIHEGNIIDKESFIMILEECVEEWKVKGQDVRFIVPDSFVVIRTVDVPNDLNDDEIKGYLYLELGTSIHLPFEDPVFDIFVLGTTENKKNVLLFAAPEQIVLDYVEVLEEVKLKPIVADIAPLSIYRLYTNLDQANPKDHLMIIQFDLPMVNVSIFHDDTPVFHRHLVIDLNYSFWKKNYNGEFEWKGEQADLMGQMEDTYTEIDRIMNFYRFSMQQGNQEVTRILLTGDHPQFDDIKKRLIELYEIPIDTIQDATLVDSNGEELQRKFHLALGLAMKEGQ